MKKKEKNKTGFLEFIGMFQIHSSQLRLEKALDTAA